MYGPTVQYSLAVEAPWKQFANRNVFNVNEAVNTRVTARRASFIVLEQLRRVLLDMPQTLDEFTGLMMMQTKQKTQRWQTVASIRRQQTLRILKAKKNKPWINIKWKNVSSRQTTQTVG